MTTIVLPAALIYRESTAWRRELHRPLSSRASTSAPPFVPGLYSNGSCRRRPSAPAEQRENADDDDRGDDDPDPETGLEDARDRGASRRRECEQGDEHEARE